MKKLLYAIPLFVANLAVMPRAYAQVSLGFPSGGFAGAQDASLTEIIENIVRVVLGFLGILTVLIILYGGFKWMTSSGNEDNIGEAKKMISAGVIGFVIILAAYAIANFVISSLSTAVSEAPPAAP